MLAASPRPVTRPMNGAEYVESLRDGREVYLYGERVEDVFLVDGPMLSNARSQIALESDLLDALRV